MSVALLISLGVIALLALIIYSNSGGDDMVESQRRHAQNADDQRRFTLDEAALFSDPDIRAAIDANRKIDAIKLVRERSGLGLKQAKELVERHTGD